MESTNDTPTTERMKKKEKRRNDNGGGEDKSPPIPPDGWTRCHAYVPRKNRFCRQLKNPGTPYCGNHAHLLQQQQVLISGNDDANDHNHTNDDGGDNNGNNETIANKRKRKRIPCPIDPTHYIWDDLVNKHIPKCPKTKFQQSQEQRPYFRRNCNCGGHGHQPQPQPQPQQPTSLDSRTLEWAQNVAQRVLQVHQTIFTTTTSGNNNINATKRSDDTASAAEEVVGATAAQDTTLEDIEQHTFPLIDLSKPELHTNGLEMAITSNRLKSGGSRHIHQQASLIGHLRRIGVLDALPAAPAASKHEQPTNPTATNNHDNNTDITEPQRTTRDDKDDDDSRQPLHNEVQALLRRRGKTIATTILELGAGRGMTGLLVAGVAATSSSTSSTHLVMVERSASRSRAEKFLRKIRSFPEEFGGSCDDYMDLTSLTSWTRVQCDLAHVDMQKINLQPTSTTTTAASTCDITSTHDSSEQHPLLVVVAKHLCGAGTDLALKSLEPIRDRIDACLMSTCCHGVCNWNDYVGRDYLTAAMTTSSDNGLPLSFGAPEFELLCLWSSGTVRDVGDEKADGCSKLPLDPAKEDDDDGEDQGDEHSNNLKILEAGASANGYATWNVTKMVESLGLKCGARGLGRACQRLIDYGRREYLRYVLFPQADSRVELLYYTPATVTPQNALLIAHRE